MNTITPQRLSIIGYYENNTGRWYVAQDRTWKVRINDDNEATAIRNSREVYRLVGDTAYDARTRRPINPEMNTHRDVVALADSARRAEQR